MLQKILCIGDSLTYGSRDEYHRGYPAELSKIFFEKEKKDIFCVNCGVPGQTSGEVLKHLQKDVLLCKDAVYALLLIGSNDTQIQMPVSLFVDNMRQIILLLISELNKKRVLVGLIPPIQGPGLLSYPKNSNKLIKEYNEGIKILSEEMNFKTVSFDGIEKYIIDTVHYNNFGYYHMALKWYESIKELKEVNYLFHKSNEIEYEYETTYRW